jgi:Fe-S cluster assembly scaffold protein SufB
MSHEASIGKIAPEQVGYLMSRGMEERKATSILFPRKVKLKMSKKMTVLS